jgi:hypothetical protein
MGMRSNQASHKQRRNQMNSTTYFAKIGKQVWRCDIDLDNGKVIDCVEVDRYPYKGKPEQYDSVDIFMEDCERQEANW